MADTVYLGTVRSLAVDELLRMFGNVCGVNDFQEMVERSGREEPLDGR